MMESKSVIYVQPYSSPCGEMVLGSFEDKLCLCDWRNIRHRQRNDNRIRKFLNAEYVEGSSEILCLAAEELDAYFAGVRKSFDVPLCLAGTRFQQSVWEALLTIPYGQTESYMRMARMVGNPKGIRAVAQAVGANSLCIFVPCHRVIGSDRSLTGFAGGLDAKAFLLEREGAVWSYPREDSRCPASAFSGRSW